MVWFSPFPPAEMFHVEPFPEMEDIMKTTKVVKVSKEAGMTPYEVEVTFNFEGLSEAQRLDLMTRSATIAWQSRARKLSAAELAELSRTGVTVEAETLFERQVGVVDPLKAVEKLSAEQAAQMLELLKKKLGQ